MKKNKIFLRISAVLVAMLIVASAIYASSIMGKKVTATGVRGAEISTSARAMCTIEVNSGRILYESNADTKISMASTTKIVTAITVLENTDDLDTPFEIDPRSIGIEGTSIYLQKGESLTVRELLLGMMLRSGNDASQALALRISKSIEDFNKLMNQTAQKAGATSSSFKNPHGLDQEGHYTTARDLALITAYAMKNPTFTEIAATKETKISGVEYPRLLRNKNRILHSMDTCVGVKTGFTKKSGRCFVGALKDHGMTIVCVVLNCGPMFEESARLMESALEQFSVTHIIRKDQFIDDNNIAIEDFFYPTKDSDEITIQCNDGNVQVMINGSKVYESKCNVL